MTFLPTPLPYLQIQKVVGVLSFSGSSTYLSRVGFLYCQGVFRPWLWQHARMIVAGTPPLTYIDPEMGAPGMTLQRCEGREWMKSLFAREQLPKLFDAYFKTKLVMVSS
jgi:hypothetical protein